MVGQRQRDVDAHHPLVSEIFFSEICKYSSSYQVSSEQKLHYFQSVPVSLCVFLDPVAYVTVSHALGPQEIPS
jgi:hypothetical protein